MNIKIKWMMVLLPILILTGCYNTTATSLPLDTPLPETPGEGSYPIPETLADIEEQTENIVRVEMKGIHHLGELDPEKEEYVWTLTVSQVEVLDVIEGSLEVGDNIYVGEPYYISHGEDLQRIGGYVPMNNGEDYLLFLSNLTHETWLEEPVDSWMIDFLGFGQHRPGKEADFYDDAYSRNLKKFQTYSDLLDYDFVASRADEVEAYKTIRQDIEEKYFSVFE